MIVAIMIIFQAVVNLEQLDNDGNGERREEEEVGKSGVEEEGKKQGCAVERKRKEDTVCTSCMCSKRAKKRS